MVRKAVVFKGRGKSFAEEYALIWRAGYVSALMITFVMLTSVGSVVHACTEMQAEACTTFKNTGG